MTLDEKAVTVRVTGTVQGVGFRDWTLREAEALGLRGWVRNETDGTVSALLVGPDDSLATMLAKLREGPRAAEVSDVAAEPADPADAPPTFRITG